MSLPPFVMSKYASKEALLSDKANYYENESNRLNNELQELKDKINEVWYTAYPESPPTDKDVAKLRIFNLYQDLKDTRFNYRVLHKAYLEMDEKLNERRKSAEEAV